MLGWRVDDRVPGEDSTEGAVGQVQRVHRPDVESKIRVGEPGDRDHRGRQVDAERFDAELVQVCGDAAGSATDVGDRSATPGQHELGECAEQRAVERLRGKFVA